MNRFTQVALTAAITTGAVFGGAQAAMASDIYVNIDHVGSPNDYGYLQTQLDWTTGGSFAFNGGYLFDHWPDGHGPYMHIWGDRSDNSSARWASCDIHNTLGEGNAVSVDKCAGAFPTLTLDSIDIWICNGGNSAGQGAVEGGCYGRKAWNQQHYPGRTSEPLGTSYNPGPRIIQYA